MGLCVLRVPSRPIYVDDALVRRLRFQMDSQGRTVKEENTLQERKTSAFQHRVERADWWSVMAALKGAS
jgi:hypothetical protein